MSKFVEVLAVLLRPIAIAASLIFDLIRRLVSSLATFVIAAAICIGLLVFLIVNAASINHNYSTINDQKNEAFRQYKSLLAKLETMDADQYNQRFMNGFNPTELTKISESFLQYDLYINSVLLKKGQTTIQSGTKDISIVLIEKYSAKAGNNLPASVLEYGSRAKSYLKSPIFKIMTTKSKFDATLRKRAEGDGYRLVYGFTNVNPGEIITVDIDKEIAKKLGLNQPGFEIIYSGGKV